MGIEIFIDLLWIGRGLSGCILFVIVDFLGIFHLGLLILLREDNKEMRALLTFYKPARPRIRNEIKDQLDLITLYLI